MIRLSNVKIDLDFDFNNIVFKVSQELNVKSSDILLCKISRKSIDARNKNNVYFVCSFDVEVKKEVKISFCKDVEEIEDVKEWEVQKKKFSSRPIVVGSGPAGMFAGIILAEAGLNPIVIERGSEVSKRKNEIELFWKTGKLNAESNVQFGEGGAGTFSDGKLMSGIKKDEFTTKVLKEFVKAGAPEEILYLAKPHIGTDNLAVVVKNIRKKILSLGGEYRFNTKLEDLIAKDGKIFAGVFRDKKGIYELEASNIILAIGHSARDTFEMIYGKGLSVEQKAFSVGVRIEHQQKLINKSQYGKFAENQALGAAEYKMAVHLPNERSCYTFCMCPGGEVVAASSEEGRVVTNGMSHFARNKENANSAILVGVTPNDFGSSHPLAGMHFQREIEENAYKAGGANYSAPAQLVGDFLKDKPSTKIGDVKPSYRPGVFLTNMGEVLPKYVVDTMRASLVEMDKKIRGFASYDAILTGVETRSSSPIKIIRDENLQSNIKGLYPCGEGAGYAGGILSAAVDGVKVAKMILDKEG